MILVISSLTIVFPEGLEGGTNPIYQLFCSKSHFESLKSHCHFFIFNIFSPFPVTKSQSQCGLNPIFPGQNLPIPIPILPR